MRVMSCKCDGAHECESEHGDDDIRYDTQCRVEGGRSRRWEERKSRRAHVSRRETNGRPITREDTKVKPTPSTIDTKHHRPLNVHLKDGLLVFLVGLDFDLVGEFDYWFKVHVGALLDFALLLCMSVWCECVGVGAWVGERGCVRACEECVGVLA